MSINRPKKPWRTSGGDWRGARVLARDGNRVTIRAHAEHAYKVNFEVDTSVFPGGIVPSPNGACVVRIGNLGPTVHPNDYAIIEARPAVFCGYIDSTNEHENFGFVAYELTGESPYWNWEPEHPSTPGLSRDRW
jgi:hypothetical protein